MLVFEGEEVDLLIIECVLSQRRVRIFNFYGAQEDENDRRLESFSKLEEEIIKAREDNCGIIIECDANAKLGGGVINGDKHKMTSNGQLLYGIIQRNGLVVGNSLESCEGVITI